MTTWWGAIPVLSAKLGGLHRVVSVCNYLASQNFFEVSQEFVVV